MDQVQGRYIDSPASSRRYRCRPRNAPGARQSGSCGIDSSCSSCKLISRARMPSAGLQLQHQTSWFTIPCRSRLRSASEDPPPALAEWLSRTPDLLVRPPAGRRRHPTRQVVVKVHSRSPTLPATMATSTRPSRLDLAAKKAPATNVVPTADGAAEAHHSSSTRSPTACRRSRSSCTAGAVAARSRRHHLAHPASFSPNRTGDAGSPRRANVADEMGLLARHRRPAGSRQARTSGSGISLHVRRPITTPALALARLERAATTWRRCSNLARTGTNHPRSRPRGPPHTIGPPCGPIVYLHRTALLRRHLLLISCRPTELGPNGNLLDVPTMPQHMPYRKIR